MPDISSEKLREAIERFRKFAPCGSKRDGIVLDAILVFVDALETAARPAIDYKAVVEGLLEEAEVLDAEFAYGYKHRASDIENFIERCTTKQVVAEPNYRAVVEVLRRAIAEYGTDGQFWVTLDALDREVERYTPTEEGKESK